MTIGEIIFAVMVAIQGILFFLGLGFMIAYVQKFNTQKSDKLYYIASILWSGAPLFSMLGVFFGIYL